MSITKTREVFSLPNVHYTLFCVLKAPVLRCNIGTFTEQNRYFCNAKQGVLQSVVAQTITALRRYCEIFTFF